MIVSFDSIKDRFSMKLVGFFIWCTTLLCIVSCVI